MRLVAALVAVALAPFVGIVLVTNVMRPAPAADRLAGVRVALAGYRIETLAADQTRLHLSMAVTSVEDVDECLAFALDEPFAGRRLRTEDGATCPRPREGSHNVALVFDLTKDDVMFRSHTVVWGIPGGRCGPLLEAYGVCVVDQAGTAKLEFPDPSPWPSVGPIGSWFPLFSFEPIDGYQP